MLKNGEILADKKEPERGEAFIRSSPIEFYWRSTLNFPFYQVAFRSTKYYGWNTILLKHIYGSSMCYCTEDF
jgi:hypothetical protein